eukprot:2657406-Pyramimonas_sp.AAC.1
MLAALRQNARPLCTALGLRSVTHAAKVVDSMYVRPAPTLVPIECVLFYFLYTRTTTTCLR